MMSLILIVGFIGVLLVLFFKRSIMDWIGENNKLVQKLKNAAWFQNQWLSGIFLFVMNANLFIFTCLVLYGLSFLFIPFVHIFVMFAAVIGSIFLWLIINRAWTGTKRERVKMGAVGSSFYMMLTFLFVYLLATLKPAFPGDDTFMRAIGLEMAMMVTIVAFVTCFVITGFSKKDGGKWQGN
jgi:hypothetical protein